MKSLPTYPLVSQLSGRKIWLNGPYWLNGPEREWSKQPRNDINVINDINGDDGYN